jgi:hypothetical protein
MAHRIVHVYADERFWRVESDDHQSRTVNSYEQALALARSLAREAGRGEVRLHFSGGRLESEFFGDPGRDASADERSGAALREQLEVERHRRRNTRVEGGETGDATPQPDAEVLSLASLRRAVGSAIDAAVRGDERWQADMEAAAIAAHDAAGEFRRRSEKGAAGSGPDRTALRLRSVAARLHGLRAGGASPAAHDLRKILELLDNL